MWGTDRGLIFSSRTTLQRRWHETQVDLMKTEGAVGRTGRPPAVTSYILIRAKGLKQHWTGLDFKLTSL